MKVTITGIMRGKNSKDRAFLQVFGTTSFSRMETENENNDCQGFKTVSVFTYTDYNVKVGDEVDLVYEPGFQGQAALSDIVVLKPADNKKG